MKRKIEYDEDTDMAYIYLSENNITKSILTDDELLVRDYDKDGNLVGLEVLSVKRLLKQIGKVDVEKGNIRPEDIPLYLICDQNLEHHHQHH